MRRFKHSNAVLNQRLFVPRVGHNDVGANARQRAGIRTPPKVERRQLREPELVGVLKVVVDPPRQRRPVFPLLIPREQGRHHDTGSSPEISLSIRVIPDK